MKLSVIIVSYKVPYFLQQTLHSVQQAAQHVPTQIIVVDNKSEDGSVEMVRELFPTVALIANTQNTGFATANNQGIAIATGDYILFLNPDTVVSEDTFVQCVRFMEQHPKVGGLGVKMIDGAGIFLPESKRGFPSPAVAFYKTFGLSSIFPKSRKFNHYHLGYLDKEQNHQVEVLSGAFMLMPKVVLDKIGHWDEAFFMYGEDIDLSYRVIKGGYQNYYLADTTIIHYKGESTKKGSLNYVKTFYEAMIIFAKKHFVGSKASTFILMLQFAIYLRGFLTLIASVFRKISLAGTDLLLTFGGLLVIKNVWEVIRFDDAAYYDGDPRLVYFNFPIYVLAWIFCVYLRGGYDRLARHRHLITGIGLGTLVIAAFYAFLPQELRFSRMLILLGMLWAIVAMYFTRSVQSWIKTGSIFWSKSPKINVAIVGDNEESSRILSLLHQSGILLHYRGQILPEGQPKTAAALGSLSDISNLVDTYQINEIIFCSKNIPYHAMIDSMSKLPKGINYKIVAAGSSVIIGSNSKNTAGDVYRINTNFELSNSIKQRNKRVLDIVYSIFFLLFYPILVWGIQHKLGFLSNSIAVLLGKKTWVGYFPMIQIEQLPKLPPAILTPIDRLEHCPDKAAIQRLNFFYAKDYWSGLDWQLLRQSFAKLGRQSF